MMNIRRSRFITALFPTVGMILVTILTFTNLFNPQDSMGLFILSLLIFFPALFFGQGMACSYGKGSLLVSLLISLVTFGVILVRFMNSTAAVYGLMYIAAALLGYGAPKIFNTGQ